jgi:hypothetical protein
VSLADLRASLAGEEPAAEEPAVEVEQPWGVAQVVTPSGLEIYFQHGPKRLYRIRNLEDEDLAEWFTVPSPSGILDCLNKGGLPWWGMKVGILGALHTVTEQDFQALLEAEKEGAVTVDHPLVDAIVKRLQAQKLDVNGVKEDAGDRGTSAHHALENYADIGTIPDPSFYPEHERGYIAGLAEFLKDANPHILFSEVMVGAWERGGWAGRFDAVANLDFAGEVVVKTYPKKKPKRAKVGGVWLLDLKTGKGVYEGYKLQTAAYAHGFQACGYGQLDHAGVVRLTHDGKYELVEVEATYEDFLEVLDVHHVIKRI